MRLHVQSKVSSLNGVRLWIAVDRIAGGAPPNLSFSLKGLSSNLQLQQPTSVVRPLSRVFPNTSGPGVFSGVYDFVGFSPGERVEVMVSGQGLNAVTKVVSVLPSRLPLASGGNGAKWFRVMLVSCFDQSQANPRGIRRALEEVKSGGEIDLTLLLGDQVYLDLPWHKNYPDNQPKLERIFEQLYAKNWFGVEQDTTFSDLLQVASHACLPDDHEYWNNYPDMAPHLQNTYTAGGRRRWEAAARFGYEGFQQHTSSTGSPEVINVDPLSIFLADSRTDRDGSTNPRNAFSAATVAALRNWVQQVNTKANGVGMFVTGQSLLDEKANWLNGKIADKVLSNYEDYDQIWQILAKLARPFILVTGDIHCGRVVKLSRVKSSALRGWEVIVSPLALCQGGGKMIQTDPDWPRHSSGEEPKLKSMDWDVKFEKSNFSNPPTFYAQKGDQLGVLSFRSVGGSVQAVMDYFPVTADTQVFRRHRKKIPLLLA
jgi:hypothetical protein